MDHDAPQHRAGWPNDESAQAGSYPGTDSPYPGEGTTATDAGRAEEGAGDRGRGADVNWPTVLVSVGLSALACALIVLVASVVLVVAYPDRSDSADVATLSQGEDEAAANGAQPSVVPKAGAKSKSTKTSTKAAAKPTASSGGSSSGGTSSGGGAAAAAAPAEEEAPAAAPVEEAPAAEPQGPLQAMSASDIENLLRNGLDNPSPDDLEGGDAAVPTIRQVGTALRQVGNVYQWRITDPVSVDEGGVMHATIGTKLPTDGGFNNSDITFVQRDDRWVLSNKSTCWLAKRAYAQCTVPNA